MKKVLVVAIIVAMVPTLNGIAFLADRLKSGQPLTVSDLWIFVISTLLGLSCIVAGFWIARSELRKRGDSAQ